MSRFSATVVLLFVSLAVEAQQPRFGEKIEVKLVEIDVVVTGRDGNRIYGLTADDFEVFEGRKRQPITNFTEYRSAATDRTGAASSSATAAPPPARQSHTLLVLIDSLPRAGFVRSRVFEDLEALLSKIMRDGDGAGVVFWTPGLERATTIIEMSSDARALRSAIRGLAESVTTGGYEPGEEAKTESAFFDWVERGARERGKGAGMDVAGQKASSEHLTGEIELMRFRRKTSAMRQLVTSFGARPGKKSLLYVSNSFALPNEPTARLSGIAMVDALAKTANAGGVTFYAVRPAMPDSDYGSQFDFARDEFARGLDALRRLTGPTGGLLDFGLRSVETLGARLADDLESYYSIAYQARSDGRDRERQIAVKTKNRQYRVRSRESFVEKSNETMAREMLLARLFTDHGGNDLHFQLEEGAPRRTGADRWQLPIVLKIPADQLQFAQEGGDRVAQVKILIMSANGVAEVTSLTEDNLRIVEGKHTSDGFVRYSVQILSDRRGSQVSIGVFDRRSGLVGIRTIDNRGRFR